MEMSKIDFDSLRHILTRFSAVSDNDLNLTQKHKQ